MWARIENGVVVELTDIDPEGRFSSSMDWRVCGEDVREGWCATEDGFSPPSDMPRSKCEEQAWSLIKAERNRRTQFGGFKVGDNWFHSDTFSRSQQLGLVMMGAAVPAAQWKTMGGDFVAMTPELASAIFQAGAASDMAVFAAAEAHRTAMLQSADPLAYDFSGNWPLAYGEEA